MSYKLPITKESFIIASKPKQKKLDKEILIPKQDDDIVQGENSSESAPSFPSQEKSKEEQRLDHYLNIISKYEGKTVDDLAREKYQSEYAKPDERSDEELKAIAQNFANAFKQEKQTELTQKAEDAVNKLEKQKTEAILDANERVQKVEKERKNNATQSKNSAIKKGVARSSIIANLLKQHDSEALQRSKDIRQKESAALTDINNQITTLEEGLKGALTALDMQSAVKLNEQLTKLKEERNKINEKAAIQNAKVDKKIQEYAKELVKTEEGKAIKELVENKGGKYMVEAKKALMDYIFTLPKAEAYAQLEREDLNRLLGEEAIAMAKRYLDMAE